MDYLRIERVLEDKLGDVAPVLLQIQKQKMGFDERDIPEELEEQFIKDLLKLSKSELGIDINSSYEKILLSISENKDILDTCIN